MDMLSKNLLYSSLSPGKSYDQRFAPGEHLGTDMRSALLRKWQKIADRTYDLQQDLRKNFSFRAGSYKTEWARSFREKQVALVDKLKAMQSRLNQPELTIALAGTTSSGKSTMANLLIGDDIMPSEVQEMSAGVVQIIHSDNEHSLTIPRTKGAHWATGTWGNLTAEKLRKKLDVTMREFRKAEKAAEDEGLRPIEPVRFEVKWPTYIGQHPERFGLPANIRLTLFDLPGLKAIDDPRNGPVIQQNIRKALSLVVYNSGETDREKQRKLVEQVADQVKKLNASPDRMLFVLNKIDVFAADGEKQAETRQRFIEETTTQLREVVGSTLKEWQEAARYIVPVTLSSRSALLARQAQDRTRSEEERLAAVNELDKFFQEVVGEDAWEEMPRKLEQATDDEIHALTEQYIEASGYFVFETALAEHISRNWQALVLGDTATEADTALNALLGELTSTLGTIEQMGLTASEEKKAVFAGIQAEIAAIDEAWRSLFENKKTDEITHSMEEDDMGKKQKKDEKMQGQSVEKQPIQKTKAGKVEWPVRQGVPASPRRVETAGSLSELFDAMSAHWQGVLLDAEELGKATLEALPDDYAKEQLPEFQARQDKLNRAVATLQSRLDHPELTLAMTGTTSSGKSTMANLLIGDDIMPSEVQEMSAGVVKIVHSDDERSLTIPKTEGSDWPTGEWTDLTAEELRKRLDDTMRAFRKAENIAEKVGGRPIDPVRFEVKWPTYIGQNPERFGLPANIRLTLLDLPGLKATDDPRNGPVIQQNIRKALSLVVYNSGETDREKQRKLVEQVADQVKKLNASPDRMLFVLNKIDVFAADGEKQTESRQRFIDETTAQLREVIGSTLKEWQGAAQRITPVTLSSRPALLAMEAQDQARSGEERLTAIKELDKQFQEVVDEDTWEEMPRKLEKATDDEIHALTEKYIQASGLVAFTQALAGHIGENLPGLLTTDVVKDAEEALQAVVAGIDTILGSAEVDSKESLEAKKKELDDLFEKVGEEQKVIIGKLESLKEYVKNSNENGIKNLSNECKEKNLLLPIYDSESEVIRKPYVNLTGVFGETVLGDSSYNISNGTDSRVSMYLSGDFSLVENKNYCLDYYNSIVNLRESPYGSVWNDDGFVPKGSKLDQAEKALNDYTLKLARICEAIFPAKAKEHGKRIESILTRYTTELLGKLEDTLEENYAEELANFPSVAGALNGIKIELPSFEAPNFEFIPSYKEVEEESHIEEREKITFATFLTLGLYKKKVHETVIDREAGVEFGDYATLTEALLRESSAFPALRKELEDYIAEIVADLGDIFSEAFGRVYKLYEKAQKVRLEQLHKGVEDDVAKINEASSLASHLKEKGNILFKTVRK